ncbi:succinate dehydrogenase subunit C [Seinonella peptonophila]|uniref:Succinate dehydrogenase subunit C n=1 Tax=Seinonella peptonophila TaxID=112248 RepID=A0A1M4U4U3_9BACL|nr:succinate dehydrogenase cytochrome b558 subunit [Seinonella peptonophila]SHE51654.1 succinate dehydrogenase subunit C [Seinonella peptonophila]
MSTQRSFFNRRLHSLLGVIPVGFFLIEHLYTNYHITGGKESFVESVNWLWGIPILLVLEVLFIFLPLMYHGIYGLYIAFRADNNVSQFGTFRNIMFMLQRVTGVITLIFVLWHIWQTRVQVAIYGWTSTQLADQTVAIMSNNIWLIVYMVGLLCAVFHFCNGMWSFLVSWGVTVGPRSQTISTYIWGAVFVAMSFVGIRTILAFASLG